MTLKIDVSITTEMTLAPETLRQWGYFSTSGREIVESDSGEIVRLLGVNWHGAEGFTHVPNGMWARNYRDMMDQMVDLGFNVIRLPVSPAILTEGPGDAIRYDLNPDLVGLSAIEVIDRIVDYASEIGIRIFFDMHRRDAGIGKQQDGLWFSDTYTEADLIADWQTIAARYAGNPTVVGAEPFNEPSGIARWSMLDPRTPPPGPEYAWVDAAGRIGDGILAVNPDLLILVNGIHIVDTKFYWVGGNLRGVRFDPVELAANDKLVYSVHDYPFGVRKVPWLDGADSAQMLANFDTNWSFLYEESLAPVLITETGSRFMIPEDLLYMETLTNYLEGVAAASPGGAGGIGLTWWSWNPNSFDTGGILKDNWFDVHPEKLEALSGLLGSAMPTTEAAARALFDADIDVVLTATAEPWHRTYLYETIDLTAVAGQDYVAKTGVLHIRPDGGSARTVLTVLSDDIEEGREAFLFRTRTADGAPVGLDKITLFDDDGAAPVTDPDPRIFIGGEETSPGHWLTRLEVKDAPLPGEGAKGWTTMLYSDLFTLSSPTKGALTQVAPDLYQLTAPALNNRWVSALKTELKAPVADMAGLETALLFAEPTAENPIVPETKPEQISPTGKLYSGDPQISVSLEVVQTYGTEFFGRITVTNGATDQTFENWELRLRSTFDFKSVTKVSVMEQDDTWIFLKAPDWDNDLTPGESFTFGLNGVLDIDTGDHIVAFDTTFF